MEDVPVSRQRRVCPVCGEANKVRRVSAIVRSQTSVNESTTRTTHATSLWNVVVWRDKYRRSSWTSKTRSVRATELARALAPPPPPGGVGCLVVAAVGLFLFSLSAFGDVLGVLIGVLLSGLCLWAASRVMVARADPSSPYRRQLARWGRLYYCATDDVVFLPGVDHAYPVSEMRDLLTTRLAEPEVQLPPRPPRRALPPSRAIGARRPGAS